MQRESEAPLVAIRDMVNKLQAYMIPTGAREEVELSAGAEMHNERTPWAAESLSLKTRLLDVEDQQARWKNCPSILNTDLHYYCVTD